MSLWRYSLWLFLMVTAFMTVLLPTTRPHRTLLSDPLLYGARGVLFAFPLVAISLLLSSGRGRRRMFPDTGAGVTLLIAASAAFALSVSMGGNIVSLQLAGVLLASGVIFHSLFRRRAS